MKSSRKATYMSASDSPVTVPAKAALVKRRQRGRQRMDLWLAYQPMVTPASGAEMKTSIWMATTRPKLMAMVTAMPRPTMAA